MKNQKSPEELLLDKIIQNKSPQEIELIIHTILIKLDNNEPLTEEFKAEIKGLLKSSLPYLADILDYVRLIERREKLNE